MLNKYSDSDSDSDGVRDGVFIDNSGPEGVS